MKRTLAIVGVLVVASFVARGTAAPSPTPTPSPSPKSGTTGKDAGKETEWVIYSTEVGWLRVGPRSEYEAKWAKKDEINGGTTEEPLKKTLLAPGFESRDAALKYVCDHLTKVQLRIAPPAAGGPARYLTGILRGKEYSLRLTKGFDEESGATMAKTGKFYKALEYDWESEWDTLRQNNITPRYVFPQRQWLIHVTGHGSVEGPVKEDRWACSTARPYMNERREYSVTLPDGIGGTIGYSIKEVEGPFLDNYTMARAMKKYRVDKVDLWPPVTSAAGRDVQPRVEADKIPENRKDYGDAVLAAQPLLPNKALEDWVIYSIEDKWLHCGTRYEFKLPLLKREVNWAGNAEEPAKKTLIAPVEGAKEIFKSRKQALRALVGELTEISTSYNPTADPKETVTAKYRGELFHLRIERGENGDFVVEGPRGLGYDFAGNVASLREIDPNITPRKTFRKQWLVHATGHGTMEGPRPDDTWMTLASEPDQSKKTFLLPDGMGGTFGYSYDKGGGPFTDSYAVIEYLRPVNKADPKVKSVGIYGEYREVNIDDIPEGIKPVDAGKPTQPPAITLKKIAADAAMQGDTLGVLILGSKIETGSRASLGIGVNVKDMTYFGRDADSPLEQWVATVEIDKDAPIGMRTLTVYNTLNSYGTLPKAFEVKEGLADLCPPLEFVTPAGASPWIFQQTGEDAADGLTEPKEKEKFLTQIRDRRNRLQDSLIRTTDAKEQHRLRWGDLESLVKSVRDTESKKQFDENVRLLKKRAELEKDVRKIETGYFKGISPLMESLSDAEILQLTESLQRRSECLFKKAADALDEARKVNYTVSWEQFAQKKLLYDIHRENLVHTLNGYQTVNSMRLLEAQRRIRIERTRILQSDPRGLAGPAAKSLRPLQRQLRDAYLDMGVVSTMLAQAQAEAGMIDQESYFAGVMGVTKQAKNIELAETFKTQSTQGLIFSMKYLLAGGTSVLGAGIDSVKRFVNWYSQRVSATTIFDTLSGDVAKQTSESREKTEFALNTLKRIRGYTDERSMELPSIVDDGTKALNSNRIFHEQTSGGLRRLAACYVTDISQSLNEELLIANEHAELLADDMEKAFNAKVGANAKGEIPFKKMLMDPIGTVRVAIQDTSWGGDHFTPTIEYIARRKGQVQEIEMARQALQKVDFDPIKLQRKLPKIYGIYLALEEDNADFLQWTVTRERLAAQRRQDKIDEELSKTFEPSDRLGLQQMAARNRSHVMTESSDKQAHVYQLQGADKMMVWDYDGALECFYQASEWNEKIQPRDRVEALRKDLAWQKSIESGMEVATQVGNMGIQAAMFEFLGQSIGKIINVPGAPAAAAETTAAQKVAAEASIWTRPIPGGGFAEFVWKQFNPFADFIKAGAVEQEWAAIGKATAGVGVNVSTQIVQQDVLKKGILQGYLGVDEQWADFLANAFVTTSQVQLGSGKSVLTEVSGWLKRTYEKFDIRIVDIPLWNERQDARTSLSDFYKYAGWLRDAKTAREKVNGKKLAAEGEPKIKAATEPVVEAQANVEKTLEPVKKEKLQELYEVLFPKGGPALDPMQRIMQIRKFFTGLNWKQHIMSLGLSKTDELGIKIDNMRRELVSMAQVEFFNQPDYVKYKDSVVAFLFIGSAGKKDSAAYKKTDSDIDFTLLVKDDTPETVRNEIRENFMKFFQDFSGGKELEAFEMSIMVDPMPKFNKTGESAAGIVNAVFGETNPQKRAQNRSELLAGIQKTIEQLIQNASDKERYLDRGNLVRHNLFVRLGCFLKKAVLQRNEDGAELVDEPASKYDELYGDIPLEPWMAFDAVIGNLGYVFGHALDHPHDNVHYQKVLAGKYAIRGALYSMLMLSPKARERMRTLSRAEVDAKGWEGAERIVVEIAKEILSQPDGMKELGLPTSLEVAGKKPIGMTAKDWVRLFDEWNYRKEGLPLHEVMGKARHLKLDKNHRLVTAYMAENIVKTEATFKAALRKTIMEQGTELMKLKNAHKDALTVGDTEAAQILELKMKEILISQAAVWNRMSREQQNLVMKEIPPEADWWLAIADVEGLKETASSPAPTKENPDRVVLDKNRLRNWQPHVFRDVPPEEISRRIILLRERAKNEPPPKVCNVGAEVAGN